MAEWDPILFYYNEEYFAQGRVGVMCETEYIRDHYWDGGPAINVYTVESYSEDIELEREKLSELLEYSKNFHPQGLWIVNEDRPVEDLLNHIGVDF